MQDPSQRKSTIEADKKIKFSPKKTSHITFMNEHGLNESLGVQTELIELQLSSTYPEDAVNNSKLLGSGRNGNAVPRDTDERSSVKMAPNYKDS